VNDREPTRRFGSSEEEPDLDWDSDEGSPKLLWGRVLALAGVLLLAFLLGRASAPDDSTEQVDRLRSQLASAEEQIADLEDRLEFGATPPAPDETPTEETPAPEDETPPGDGAGGGGGQVETYTVRSGDTYTSIAEDLLGDPGASDCISEANNDEPLNPGDEIQVPESCAEE
jgi:nucleoid-associated protein YgaU